MKPIIVFISSVFTILSCGDHDFPKEKKTIKCDRVGLKMSFEKGIANFVPSDLDLYESFKSDYRFFEFLEETDSLCLKNNNDFDNFTIIILIKQYNFQKKKYHQGFDLLMMRKGCAKIIIDNFCRLAKIGRIEMLNSSYILEYINQEGLHDKYKKYIDG